MAAVQPPRTRSARLVAGFTTKTANHAPPASATHAHHGPSALSIFLTNLNLLDLDQLQDWPAICAETFATDGTSAQGLKKRVHCVEWALFHLFSLWDPEETKKVSDRSSTLNRNTLTHIRNLNHSFLLSIKLNPSTSVPPC